MGLEGARAIAFGVAVIAFAGSACANCGSFAGMKPYQPPRRTEADTADAKAKAPSAAQPKDAGEGARPRENTSGHD